LSNINSHSDAQISPKGQWWLVTDDKPEGPHSNAYVLAALQSGRVFPDTLACPDGGQDWQPLKSYSEFAHAAVPSSPSATDQVPTGFAPQSKGVTDAGAMPQMYNLICTYSLFVVPIYWLVGHLSCCMYEPLFHEDSGFSAIEGLMLLLDEFASLILTALFAFAGWNFRSLRRLGVSLFQIAFWSNLGFNVLLLLSTVVVLAIASASQIDHFAPESDTAVISLLVDVTFLLIGSLMFAFEVVAMVWLHRNRAQLPLTEAAL